MIASDIIQEPKLPLLVFFQAPGKHIHVQRLVHLILRLTFV